MAEHPGFVPGSEAYLAGVWYVMKDAKESYEKNRGDVAAGRRSPWGFLTKIRKALGYPAQTVSYHVMRQELIDFAETFGVDLGHPAAPVSTTTRDAQKEFSS